VHDVGDARKVLVVERLDRELTVGDGAHECFLGDGSDSRLEEMGHLRENRDGQHDV
jgi:hypothetical protein